MIERHGGTVEGFIGDAVVGVFGMTEVHEDDALRAVRAAVELREAGAALSAELERERGVGIAMKLGVESGEVFVSAGARRTSFAAGDAFNVASRLEGDAADGRDPARREHLRLVRDAVQAEPLEPLALQGPVREGAGLAAVELQADHPVPAPAAGDPLRRSRARARRSPGGLRRARAKPAAAR